VTLATILNSVCDEIGIGRPTTYFGNTDPTARQLVALAQTECEDLMSRTRWENLIREATHTTLAAESQGAIATIAPGFRSFIARTQWNRTRQWPLGGPDSPQMWQTRQATVNTGVFNNFRLRGGLLMITPAPPAGETIAFEYNSEYFCESGAGTDQTAWTADTDVPLLTARLIKWGLIWRFRKAKGLDYGEDFRLYEERVVDAIAQDGSAPVLDMSDPVDYVPQIVAPEGSWNIP
jgi:hypothetical protein